MYHRIYHEYLRAGQTRSVAFWSLVYHAYVGFSIGLKRLFLRLFREKQLFSGFIVRLTVAGYGTSTLRMLVSACVNIGFFLFGKFGYGTG
jgi:hypothetical protein